MEYGYTIDEEAACSEIGTGLQKIKTMAEWLYPSAEGEASTTKLQFRLSPSVITRSEAELLGVSTPRFAVRTYLNKDHTSFLNIRRLGKLAISTATARGSRLNRFWYRLFKPSKARPMSYRELLSVVEDGQAIADSLLTPPERYADCHFITTDLGLAYGEGKEIAGVPFLQHLLLSGGLCAQAACFVAIALLNREAKSLPALAEITSLCGPEDGNPNSSADDSEISLGGMTVPQTITALKSTSIGLWAANNYPKLSSERDKKNIQTAMKSYLFSGIPLILPVDLGRLCGDLPSNHLGDSVIRKNGLKLISEPRFTKQNHAVTVVGCASENVEYQGDDDVFFYNDPAIYPFLKASLAELIYNRRYANGIDTNLIPNAPQEPFSFISVSPSKAVLSLLREKSWSYAGGKVSEVLRQGLFDIASGLQTIETSLGLPNCKPSQYEPGRFRLIDCKSQGFDSIRGMVPEAAFSLLLEFIGSCNSSQRWIWLQVWQRSNEIDGSQSSLWLWDAQVRSSLQPSDEYARYLLGCIHFKADAWEVTSPGSD